MLKIQIHNNFHRLKYFGIIKTKKKFDYTSIYVYLWYEKYAVG